jgi:hypothetical protein
MRVLLVAEGRHEGGGALAALVQRTATAPVKSDFCTVRDPRIHVHRGKGGGFFKRALAWMREAQNGGYDALVLVIDEDGDRIRLGQFDEAQESDAFGITRALGIAIRTFDAWMLADEKALSRVLGTVVARQSDPEKNKDPKSSCAGLLAERDHPMSQTDFYAALADATDIAVLENRCPKGFAPFASRVRRLG